MFHLFLSLGLSLLCHLMNSLPESFSLGEAMIISQGLTVLSLEVIKDFASPVTSSQKFGACLQVSETEYSSS